MLMFFKRLWKGMSSTALSNTANSGSLQQEPIQVPTTPFTHPLVD